MRDLSWPNQAGHSIMKHPWHKAKQIIRKPITAAQLIAQGKAMAYVFCMIKVPQPTYHL